MEQLVEQFLKVMREEKAIYQDLLSLSENKTDAIADKNVNNLDAIVRQEQSAILRLNQCEKRRLHYVGLLCQNTGEHPETVTMLRFAEYATPDGSLELHALHDELSDILKRLSDKNHTNRALLESRLEYVHFAMDMLNTEQSPGVYDMGGFDSRYDSGVPAKGKTIIDRKV